MTTFLLRICASFILVTLIACKKNSKELTEDLPIHNKRVLILGNSITQNGRYVDFLEYYLRKQYPSENLDIISIGLSSETVSGDSEANHPFPRPWLHNRLKRALELIQPEVVLALYGMNDGIYSQKDQVRFNNYKRGIRELMDETKAIGAELILLTPTPFDPDPAKDRLVGENVFQSYKTPYYNYSQVLSDYSDWLDSLQHIKVINLNQFLTDKLKRVKTMKQDSTFVPDAVHPNAIGHYYMSQKILKDLYPSVKMSDDVVSELQLLSEDSLFLVSSKRRHIRSQGWLEYIGYTKESTVRSDDINTTKDAVNQLDLELQRLQNK